MGCDIHGVVERKVKGKWIACNILRADDTATDRNYGRFAALANVRGDGPEPKGFPDDASDTSTLLRDEWNGDGHSHSWLPLAEAAKIFAETQWFPPTEKADAFPKKDWVQKYPAYHYFRVEDYDVGDCRLVFWFDN